MWFSVRGRPKAVKFSAASSASQFKYFHSSLTVYLSSSHYYQSVPPPSCITHTLCSKRNGFPVLLPLSFLHDAAFETEILEIGKSKLIFSFQNAYLAIYHLNVAILMWSFHQVLGQHYSTCDVGTDCLVPCQVCDSQPPLKHHGVHFLRGIEFLVWMCGICTHRNFHPMSLPSQLESHPQITPRNNGGRDDKDGTRSWVCSNHNYFLASWCPFAEVSALPR
jgi:hypothetical protein